jgi:hypothetical protein
MHVPVFVSVTNMVVNANASLVLSYVPGDHTFGIEREEPLASPVALKMTTSTSMHLGVDGQAPCPGHLIVRGDGHIAVDNSTPPSPGTFHGVATGMSIASTLTLENCPLLSSNVEIGFGDA